jgi:ribonuclease T2
MWVLPLLLASSMLAGAPAGAFERLEGYFIAWRNCELFQSKNERTNPGNLFTEPWKAYEMIGSNLPGRDYYQVRVSEAPGIQDRWVEATCGFRAIEPEADVSETLSTRGSEVREIGSEHVLALSWHSAFCEAKPATPECALLNAGDLPMAEIRLSVHGLWPQPREREYCGVPDTLERLDRQGRWSDLPSLDLSRQTQEALVSAMPGTHSFLHRHEWIKHGTCYDAAGAEEEYFSDAVFLARAVNQSAVARFLARMLGEEIRTETIRDRFDEAFGSGAGARVGFQCSRDGARTLLQEVRVNLRGDIGPGASSIADLILAADPVPQGCVKGIVDPFGLQ